MNENIDTQTGADFVSQPLCRSICRSFGEFQFERLKLPEWRSKRTFRKLMAHKYHGQLNAEFAELLRGGMSRSDAEKRIATIRANFEEFILRCEGVPTYLVLGTAREQAVHTHERQILDAFGKIAGLLRLGCVNGWASTGAMGVACRSQVLGWNNDFEVAKNAPLIGVPLKFRHQTTEVPFDAKEFLQAEWAQDSEKLAETVWVAPKHGTIQTRTGLGLFGLTEICITVFCGGGFGTDEEHGTDGLGRQLREGILTHYSEYRESMIPARVWIDSPLSDGSRWYHDGKLMHIEGQLDRGAINISDAADIHVIRLGQAPQETPFKNAPFKVHYFNDPQGAACFMMKLAMRTFCALQQVYEETK